MKEAFLLRGLTLEVHNAQEFFCILKSNYPKDSEIIKYKISPEQVFSFFKKTFNQDLYVLIEKKQRN